MNHMTCPLIAKAGQTLCLPSDGGNQRPFINQAHFWRLSQGLACAAFDQQTFRPELFEQFSIPCPRSIQAASAKRQAEYLASRWLVREIFSHYGVQDFMLRKSVDRSPQWPKGFSGSLSHCCGQIFLVTDPCGRLAGNDTEHWVSPQVADEITPLLMTAQDQRLLDTFAQEHAQKVTLLFSLKESLYKALWPQVRCEMDFSDAELIAANFDKGTAVLQLTRNIAEGWPAGANFHFSFVLGEQRVFSWLLPD